jgi:hypothetical protein
MANILKSNPSWIPDFCGQRKIRFLTEYTKLSSSVSQCKRNHNFIPLWTPSIEEVGGYFRVLHNTSNRTLELVGHRVDVIRHVYECKTHWTFGQNLEEQREQLKRLWKHDFPLWSVDPCPLPWMPLDNLITKIENDMSLIDVISTLSPVQDSYDPQKHGSYDPWNQRPEDNRQIHLYKELIELIEQFGKGRSVILGQNFAGLGPAEAEPNDLIYSLAGGSSLFILRQKGLTYSFIGECAIHLPVDDPCGHGFDCVATVWKQNWKKTGVEIITLN